MRIAPHGNSNGRAFALFAESMLGEVLSQRESTLVQAVPSPHTDVQRAAHAHTASGASSAHRTAVACFISRR
jgi:hypothetical protein